MSRVSDFSQLAPSIVSDDKRVQEPNIWAVFFAGLVSIRMHPRNGDTIDDAELCRLASVADQMYLLYQARGGF